MKFLSILKECILKECRNAKGITCELKNNISKWYIIATCKQAETFNQNELSWGGRLEQITGRKNSENLMSEV